LGRPKDADSAVTVERILKATHDLIQEQGVDGVSLRRVAAAADLAVGGVRYYFPTSESLLEAVLDDYHRQLLAMAEVSAAQLRPDLSNLREAGPGREGPAPRSLRCVGP